MGFPRFLVGQRVSAFDNNGSIVEGIIYKTNDNKKMVKVSESYSVPLSEIKTIKYVGKRLDEEVEEKIKDFSDNKMNWEQAVKDNSDTDKLADQFGNFCAAALGDNGNKDEVKEIAKSEAEMKIMDAKVKNGVSSKDAEIAKYIDIKSDKIKEAEMSIKNKLQEGDAPFDIDYGQDNVYPPSTDTKNSVATSYEDPIEENAINPDADQSNMIGASTHIEGQHAEAVSPIEDEVLKDAESLKEPMKTDMTVVEAADTYDEAAEYEKSLAEIDDILKDDDYTLENDDSSRLDTLKAEVVEKTGVSDEKAENIISDIKDDVESTIVHGVKDILNAYDSFDNSADAVNSNLRNAISDAVYNKDEEEPTINDNKFNIDDLMNDEYENDAVDNEVEEAIDSYIDENENYNDTDLYESLCNKFNIENKDQLLLEANGIIPDAILLMTEEIRQRKY